MEKKRLGRGLAALIPETPPITKELAIDQTETGDTVAEISLSRIQPGGHQPRRRFEEGALRELAESIKAGGVIQPLILRALSDDRYEIIAGERRWRASRIAGLETIPAIIMEADDRKVMEVSVIENLQREDLNPIEEAEAYVRLIEEFGLSQDETAMRVGKNRSTVANSLRLLRLPKSLQTDIASGNISAGHARALLTLPTTAAQMGLAERIKAQGLSVRETEAIVSRPQRPGRKRPAAAKDVHIRQAVEDLKRKFGAKVSIRGNTDKGRINFEYYSNDDLIRLVELLKQ